MAVSRTFSEQMAAVLAHLKCPAAPLLGQGNEGAVFAYDREQVVKIYANVSRAYLEHLAALQTLIDHYDLPFATPLIQEIGQVAETSYTRERRLSGVALDTLFPKLTVDEQQRVLANYLAALQPINAITLPHLPYGQALQIAGAITASSWPGFLSNMLHKVSAASNRDVQEDVPEVAEKISLLHDRISRLEAEPPKRLVHGDYFLGNVLFNEDLTVAAVLDFSPHTLVGDPRMDVAGALAFLELDPAIGPQHSAYLRERVTATYGPTIHTFIDIYVLYYSVYFADTKLSDPLTYAWCVRNLHDATRWAGVWL